MFSAQGAMVTIPMTSLDGVSPIPVVANVPPFPTEFCGGLFGISTGAKSTPMQSKLNKKQYKNYFWHICECNVFFANRRIKWSSPNIVMDNFKKFYNFINVYV